MEFYGSRICTTVLHVVFHLVPTGSERNIRITPLNQNFKIYRLLVLEKENLLFRGGSLPQQKWTFYVYINAYRLQTFFK